MRLITLNVVKPAGQSVLSALYINYGDFFIVVNVQKKTVATFIHTGPDQQAQSKDKCNKEERQQVIGVTPPDQATRKKKNN